MPVPTPDSTPLTRAELNDLLQEMHEQCEVLIEALDGLNLIASTSQPGLSHEEIPLQIFWAMRRALIAHARHWPITRRHLAENSRLIADKLRRLRGE